MEPTLEKLISWWQVRYILQTQTHTQKGGEGRKVPKDPEKTYWGEKQSEKVKIIP